MQLEPVQQAEELPVPLPEVEVPNPAIRSLAVPAGSQQVVQQEQETA